MKTEKFDMEKMENRLSREPAFVSLAILTDSSLWPFLLTRSKRAAECLALRRICRTLQLSSRWAPGAVRRKPCQQ
jgi:hypothetical protein